LIERKISEYFQHLSSLHFNNTEEKLLNYDITKITNRFNSIYENMSNIDYFVDKFGLDANTIENCNFDFEKKYIKIEHENITYIKLRLKDSKYWNDILSDILKTEIILINDYDTQDKIIGPLYKKFNNEYKLPLNFFNSILSCEQLKKYYTNEERMEYINMWQQKLCGYFPSFSLAEYNLYIGISIDNRNNENKLNDHYRDDGCVCYKCKKKRVQIINNIKNGKMSIDNKVRHNYDYNYNGVIFLRIYANKTKSLIENDSYIERAINYFNFY
jgi:hypothetical protein